MRTRFAVVVVGFLVASALSLAAQTGKATDLPYVGTWKLNLAKSDFGETTVTFAEQASGEMQFTAAGQSYTFRTDGKDYPSLFGRTAAWKQIDPATWETIIKQDGRTLVTEKTTLSSDGKTLTVNTKGPKPAGGTFEETTVYERASGGQGLSGKWKTKNIKSSAPTVLEIASSGDDGLAIRIPDFKISADMKFDGKDYPAIGPDMPRGLTLAIEKTGPRSFDLTEKQDGKPIFKLSFVVSDDGNTMTETGGAVGVDEKFKAVYERQGRT